jgi:hypothetical protein
LWHCRLDQSGTAERERLRRERGDPAVLTLEGFQAMGSASASGTALPQARERRVSGWEGALGGNYVSREIGEPGNRTGTMIGQAQVQF